MSVRSIRPVESFARGPSPERAVVAAVAAGRVDGEVVVSVTFDRLPVVMPDPVSLARLGERIIQRAKEVE